MIICTLQGKNKCGKTTTIKYLVATLIDQGTTIIWDSHGYDEHTYHAHLEGTEIKGEVSAVLQNKDKIIAVTTVGDYPKLIAAEIIKIFANVRESVDCLVCASHSTRQIERALDLSYIEKILKSNLSGYIKEQEIVKIQTHAEEILNRITSSGVQEKCVLVVEKTAEDHTALWKHADQCKAHEMLEKICEVMK